MPLSASELFARTDDGAGGAVGTFKRRVKFTVRHVWYRREMARLHQAFQAKSLDPLFDTDLRLLFKATRPYLCSGLDGGRRFQAQTLHFDWLATRFSASEVHAFYARGSALLGTWTLGENTLTLHLVPAAGLAREGELEVHMNLNEQIVLRAAISVLPSRLLGLSKGGHVLFVGSLQGTKDAKELVRAATHAMERTKPTAIMLNALQGIAKAWELKGLVGVSDRGHVYANYRSLSKRVGVSYDQLWQELGAQAQATPLLWSLPLQWVPRPESEVESKKRSQLRRRNAWRQQVVEACSQGARHLAPA